MGEENYNLKNSVKTDSNRETSEYQSEAFVFEQNVFGLRVFSR